MGLVSVELLPTVVVLFLVHRLFSLYSVPHRLLNGLNFSLFRKTDDSALTAKQKKSKKKKNGPDYENTQHLIVTKVQQHSLVNHFMYQHFDFFITMGVSAVACFLFSEAWGCSTASPLLRSDMSYYFLLGIVVIVVWLQGSVVARLGLNSYEAILVFVTFVVSSTACFAGLTFLPESFFNFGLGPAFLDFVERLNRGFAAQHIEWRVAPSPFLLRSLLSFSAGVIAGAFYFPARRVGNIHGFIRRHFSVGRVFVAMLNLLSPVVVVVLWVKPLAFDLLVGEDPLKGFMSEVNFERLRVVCVLLFAVLRLVSLRIYVQAFFSSTAIFVCEALSEDGRVEGGATFNLLKDKVQQSYNYVVKVALDALSVGAVSLAFGLMYLRASSADCEWGVCAGLASAISSFSAPSAAAAAESLASSLVSVAFHKAVLGFFCFWTSFSWGVLSLFFLPQS